MEDREMVEGLFRRDPAALEELEKAYGSRLLRLAGRFLKSREDGEEAVNETLFRVWSTIPPNRPEGLFPYAARICRYTALEKVDWLRAKKRSATVVELTRELAQCLPDLRPEREAEGREIGKALNGFLAGLPSEKRRLFLLRYWYGASVRELGESFGAGESWVKTTLHRLRKELKIHLEKEGIFL